jgi:osmotically-inducible protein OsmY
MNRLKTLFLIVSLFIISGCAAPIMLFGGVAGAGATLSKEKTVGSTIDDRNIWTKIKAGLLEHNKQIDNVLNDVSVEVSEGRVLLTGTVKTSEERLLVLKIVWEQAGVKEVINEIKLPSETNQNNLKQYGSDSWITTQVKSKMLVNNHVRSINYSVETIDGTVYILGIARTEEELDAIREITKNVKGIDKFVSYIRVNSKHEVKEKDSTEVIGSGNTKKVPQKEEPKEKASNPIHDEEEEIEIEYLDSDD